MTGGFKLAILAVALGLIALGIGRVRGHWIGVGEQRVQARWDAQAERDRAAAAENAAELERIARLAEVRKQTEAERIAREQEARLSGLAQRADAVDARNRGLLGTIAALNGRVRELSRATAHAGAAAVVDDPAVIARELLGQCSSRYAAVAADAGRLASQVMGLQQYAGLCLAQGVAP